jgi:hypothetical protein
VNNHVQESQTAKKETVILIDERDQGDLWVTLMLQALSKLGIKARIVIKREIPIIQNLVSTGTVIKISDFGFRRRRTPESIVPQ